MGLELYSIRQAGFEPAMGFRRAIIGHVPSTRLGYCRVLKALSVLIYGDSIFKSRCIMRVKCKNCNKSFSKLASQIKKTENNFCSRSCSAQYNNSRRPKKHKSKTCKQEGCSVKILSCRFYCDRCIAKGRHLNGGKRLQDKTLGEVCRRESHRANLYADIRTHARKSISDRTQTCQVCGYDKHVHCCHIKGISEFSDDSLISEINHPDNLVLLCPNCHWEFDNHVLDIYR